jgi:hypothetical protein
MLTWQTCIWQPTPSFAVHPGAGAGPVLPPSALAPDADFRPAFVGVYAGGPPPGMAPPPGGAYPPPGAGGYGMQPGYGQQGYGY